MLDSLTLAFATGVKRLVKRIIALTISGVVVAVIFANWVGGVGELLGFNNMLSMGLIFGVVVVIILARSETHLPQRNVTRADGLVRGDPYRVWRMIIAFGVSVASLTVTFVITMLIQQSVIDWFVLGYTGICILVMSIFVVTIFSQLREHLLGATVLMSAGMALILGAVTVAVITR